MTMTRRDFLKSALSLAALAPAARLSTLAARADEAPAAAAPAATGGATGVTRRPYRDTDVTIPLLGFGLMRLPQKDNGLDYELIDQLLDRALAAGVNYFDTAYVYIGGKSERCVGDLLSKRPRESYFLATKMPVRHVHSEADTERIFQEQLDRTKAGYFDFYLLHNIGWHDWEKSKQLKIVDFLERKKSEGVIKRLGFSCHDSPQNHKRIVKDYHWDFCQIQVNIQDWEEGPGRVLYETLSEANVPAIVMEPLRGGRLASLGEEGDRILRNVKPDDSTASWAFRFVGSLPNVLVALSGMNRMDHLEENIRTFSPLVPLTEFEQRTLRTAYAASRKTISIPCTGCRYCVPCPVEVQIPDIFALANDYHRNHDLDAFKKGYDALAKEGGIAADCVNCGSCLPKCPQHIEIPKELAKITPMLKA